MSNDRQRDQQAELNNKHQPINDEDNEQQTIKRKRQATNNK